MDIEELGSSIIGSAIKVHRVLGPGLLESAYQKCLDYELRKIGLRVDCELAPRYSMKLSELMRDIGSTC